MQALKRCCWSHQLLRMQLMTKSNISTCTLALQCKVTSTANASPNEADNTLDSTQQQRKSFVTLGQPSSETHPHLIQPHELVPGITLAEFQQRRTTFMQSIQNYGRTVGAPLNGRANANHLYVLSSATKKYMSGHIPYVFRQNSDFYYLTGCLEPDSALVLTIDELSNMKSILFMRPKDDHAELWDGARTGPDQGLQHFGVDEAYPMEMFDKIINQYTGKIKPQLWFEPNASELKNINRCMQNLSTNTKSQMLPSNILLQNMRLVKSAAEMDLMRRTCEIAAVSFNEVMRESHPGQSEHHLYAAIDYECRMRNASFLAYPPVVASGKNATTIHYVNNNQIVQPNSLVLMDAGCEYGGYTSDITRTWPISGDFTEPQRILYEMMVQLQKELIGLIMHTSGETLDQLFETTCFKLGKYLQEIGLVDKSLSDYKSIATEGYKFCPHHVSHYLGMDVHDTPSISRNIRIQPGMVFTIEPGIYIDKKRTDIPIEFREIGIRIEDDILINEHSQIEVLSGGCAKEHKDIQLLTKKTTI